MDSARTEFPDGVARLEIRGIIGYVDLFDREVGVEVPGGTLAVDIPTDCPIFLREERVKLRFLQCGDHAEITCLQTAEALVAENICVSWRSLKMPV